MTGRSESRLLTCHEWIPRFDSIARRGRGLEWTERTGLGEMSADVRELNQASPLDDGSTRHGHSGDRESDTVGRWMDPWRPYMIAPNAN